MCVCVYVCVWERENDIQSVTMCVWKAVEGIFIWVWNCVFWDVCIEIYGLCSSMWALKVVCMCVCVSVCVCVCVCVWAQVMLCRLSWTCDWQWLTAGQPASSFLLPRHFLMPVILSNQRSDLTAVLTPTHTGTNTHTHIHRYMCTDGPSSKLSI